MTRLDRAFLIAFVYLETKYGTLDEIAAVAWCILNRAARGKKQASCIVAEFDIAKQMQFKQLVCDYLSGGIKNDRYFGQVEWIINGVIEGKIMDVSNGAEFYMRRENFISESCSNAVPTAYVGDFVFLKEAL
ncbi:MAG: hypothetical protein QXP49_07015 [Nitrososphaerota archaeon]